LETTYPIDIIVIIVHNRYINLIVFLLPKTGENVASSSE